MLSQSRNKTSRNNFNNMRSPSIPSEIGPGGENFQAYFLEGSSEPVQSSSSTLGISRPSYCSPDKLDFSPVLQSQKRMVMGKSVLDKYHSPAVSSNSTSQSSPNYTSSRSSTPSETYSKNNETVKQSNQSKVQLEQAEQAVNSPFRSFRQKQRKRAIRKSEERAARIANSKNTAPFRNPIKALKLGKSSKSTKQAQSQEPEPNTRRVYDSCSSIDMNMDGSIDLQRSFPTQYENTMRTNGHVLFNNERFFTPAQQSGFSDSSSVSSRVSTDSNPLLTTHPLALSSTSSKGQALGITAAPKSSTKRIIVPHVKPSKTKNVYTIFVLLIQPSRKIFELVRLNYNPTKTTLRKLLQMVPYNSTEEALSNQVYTGFCRPNASSSSNKTLSNLSLTASVMARDGSCARIACGEVLAAIPEGYTSKETQILSRHIMKNPKMSKLLSKKNPLSRSRYSKYLKSKSNPEENSNDKGHMGIQPPNYGIQPRNSQMAYTETDMNIVSSSVMFTPLTDTIAEESSNNINDRNDYRVKKRAQSPIGKLAAKLERENTKSNLICDNSCNSSITSIHSLRRAPLSQKIVTNIEMKHKLNNLEAKVNNLEEKIPNTKLPEPRIVDDVYVDDKSEKDMSNQEVSLCASQLDAIKREAAEAARVAAEEAFSKRMEELVQTLDVSDEEKNRLLENDDMSYHSAMSFAMNGSFASLPLTKDDCDFPVSVTISAQDPPPIVEPSILSPHGSYGAYASEFTLAPSPYAPVSGVRLLTPLGPSQRRPGSLLSPIPVMTSPDTTSDFAPKASSPSKFSDSMLKHQEAVNRTMNTMNTTFTQSSDEFDDDLETSLISEAMEGFYAVTKTAVSKFVDRRKKKLSELPSKIMKHKLHLKVMSIVCLMFLSSQSMSSLSNEDTKDLNQIFNFSNYNRSLSLAEGENKKSFTILDLQQILFWFLLLTKGQHFLSESRPRRRKRRAWKSRIVPVKHF